MSEDSFRTVVPVAPADSRIRYQDGVVFLGSCFTEHIGQRMERFKFQVNLNPFGILFQPLAVARALDRIIAQQPYTAEELLHHNEKWISLDHHGKFSGADQNIVLQRINASIHQAHDALRGARYLMLTLGTAWAYTYRETGKTVANCHKIPNNAFEKNLLHGPAIQEALEAVLQQLAVLNPGLQVVFTVSPVRHWKDGAVENQRSKAILLSTVHQLVDQFPQVHYFPAYEIMMDDLRDYRFYASDLLHPNDVAIDYIWNRFRESWLDPDCEGPMKRVDQLRTACEHRPFDPESNSFQRFVQRHLDLINALETDYPFFDLTEERAHFQSLKL
ncbi:MAG: GSCFA domain-containing protein [Bacteroidota bacterium]